MTPRLSSTRIPFLLLAILGALLCACGSAGQRPPAEAPQAAATAPEPAGRAEIARLWDEIASMRARAGTGASLDAGEDAAPAAERAAAAVPAEPADPASVAAAIEGPDATCPAETSGAPMCHDTCTLAASICDNAEHICRLAGELSGDAWAARKCADAAAVCRDATAQCCGCRAG